MMTISTTAKPLRGHTRVIQRNALQSWKALHLDVEIILFGDDPGAAEAAQELGLHHEPLVEHNEFGTKRLDYLFARAQAIAQHEILCYINCDIILMQDFLRALGRVRAIHREFLMVGRRWDTDITEPLPFDQYGGQSVEQPAPHWEDELRRLALSRGRRRTAEWIDYFAFSRGLYGPDMPPFVLRVFWDNWLVWKALDSGQPVIDASRAVMAVHQNHDYSYHPQGKAGVWSGEEAGRNAQLAGRGRHLRTIADATELLHTEEFQPNVFRNLSAAKRYIRQAGRLLLYVLSHPVCFVLLNLTRPLRRSLRHSPRHQR